MRGLVCVGCQKFFRIKKMGVYVEEGMPRNSVPHSSVPDTWGPYKLWVADLFECPGCGARVVAGFSRTAVAEHYQEDYEKKRQQFPPMFRVDDCGGARP